MGCFGSRHANKEHDEGRTPRRLEKKLNEIPGDLYELFRNILTRDCHNRDELLLCVQWILFSRQPLRPEELYFAVLSGTEPEDVSAWDQDEMPTGTIKRSLLNSSKGLAEVTKSSIPTVQFIHESVKDFLLKEHGLSAVWSDLSGGFTGKSHDRLKQCCLQYMGIDVVDHLSIGDTVSSTGGMSSYKKMPDQFPFLKYAVKNALWHAEAAQTHGICQRNFLRDFVLPQWLKMSNMTRSYRRCTLKASLLYVLGEHNLPALIKACENNQHAFE